MRFLTQIVAQRSGHPGTTRCDVARPLESSSVASTILRGSLAGLLVRLFTLAMAFGTHCILARVLGAEQYGIFAFVLSVVGICLPFATLGFETSLIRFLPEYKSTNQWPLFKGVLHLAHWMAALSGMAIAFLMAAGVIIGFDHVPAGTAWALLAGAVCLPFRAVVSVSQAGLRGLKRIVLSQLPWPIVRASVLAGSVGGLAYGFRYSCNATEALGFNFLGLLAAVVVAGLWLRRAVPEECHTAAPSHETRKWLRTSLPMLLVAGMRGLLKGIDIVLIGLLLGTTDAGIYAVASRLAQLMTFGLTASNSIAAPVISELFTTKKLRELQHATTIACLLSTSLAVLIGGGLLLAPSQLTGLFGPQFHAGITALLILAVGYLINAITGPVGQLLNMTGHQDTNARIFGLVIVLKVVLNYPAILYWGIEGAAVITSSTIALKNIWTWFVVRRRLGVNSLVIPIPITTPGRH